MSTAAETEADGFSQQHPMSREYIIFWQSRRHSKQKILTGIQYGDGTGDGKKPEKCNLDERRLGLKSNLWFNKSNTRQWSYRRVIERGDAGMFVTSNRGKEAKCVSEIIDLLYQDLEGQSLRVETTNRGEASTSDADCTQQEEKEDGDIEAQIRKEIGDMKPNKSTKKDSNTFQAVKLDIPCLSFIKIDKTLDPVQIAHRLCKEASEDPAKKRSRWIQRITPVTLTQKVLGGGLEQLSREVLKPHFHSGGPSKKPKPSDPATRSI
ncbi:THUMP domain-containing protein [Histoplasma capsulatum]|uniref:THUMP domain-containing protein n=1 Tax=Ajellomyces capsulatus TaxID=5037 RepID=A0A8A1MK03_AJECA|nr:THUMP domain-containing protein [Histoplasma capsulatum]